MSNIKKKLKLKAKKINTSKQLAKLKKQLLNENLSDTQKNKIKEEIELIQNKKEKLKKARMIIDAMIESDKSKLAKYKNKGNATFIPGGGTGLKR